MDDETTMDDQLEDQQATPVHVVRRHVSPQTMILRLGTQLNLAKYPTYQVTNAIGVAAGLTASEVRGVNIQATAPMYVPRHMNSLVARRVVNSSLPANNPNVQRTNVNLSASTARDRTGLATHGVPRNSRPTSSPASPRKKDDSGAHQLTLLSLRRAKQGQSRPTKPTKKNDQNYPSLPLQNRFSALQDTTPDPQPDPQREPRPRSGSLPGYTTKRQAPPPLPPKPKTPSYVRELHSQKPPASSEEPPAQAAKAVSIGQGESVLHSTGSQCQQT
ncbi:hypothetical protein MTO96_047892 [Rhipicephalus appendiculatus]